MNFTNSTSHRHPTFTPVQFARAGVHPRLAFAWGAFLLLIVELTGCSVPSASAQVAALPKSRDLRLVTIESTEVAYLSIANVTEKIALPRWQSAGWKLGNTLGAEDAVPTDCALHARDGTDTQVYAACIGPVTVAVLPDGADIIYVTVIIGQDGEVRSANVIVPD